MSGAQASYRKSSDIAASKAALAARRRNSNEQQQQEWQPRTTAASTRSAAASAVHSVPTQLASKALGSVVPPLELPAQHASASYQPAHLASGSVDLCRIDEATAAAANQLETPALDSCLHQDVCEELAELLSLERDGCKVAWPRGWDWRRAALRLAA